MLNGISLPFLRLRNKNMLSSCARNRITPVPEESEMKLIADESPGINQIDF